MTDIAAADQKKRIEQKQREDEILTKLSTQFNIRKQTLQQLNIVYWLYNPLENLKFHSNKFSQNISKFGFRQKESSNNIISLLGQQSLDGSVEALNKQIRIEIFNCLRIQKCIKSTDLTDFIKKQLRIYKQAQDQIMTFNRSSLTKMDEFDKFRQRLAEQITAEINATKIKKQKFDDETSIINQQISQLNAELRNLESQKAQKKQQGMYSYSYYDSNYQQEKNKIINETNQNQSTLQNINFKNKEIINTINRQIEYYNIQKKYFFDYKMNECKKQFLNNYRITYTNDQDKQKAYRNSELPTYSLDVINQNVASANNELQRLLTERDSIEVEKEKQFREQLKQFRKKFGLINHKKNLQIEIQFIDKQIEIVKSQIQELTEDIGVFNDSQSNQRIQKTEEQSSLMLQEIPIIKSFLVPQEYINTISTVIAKIEKCNDFLEKQDSMSSPSFINFSEINKLPLDIITSSAKITQIKEFAEQITNTQNNIFEMIEEITKLLDYCLQQFKSISITD